MKPEYTVEQALMIAIASVLTKDQIYTLKSRVRDLCPELLHNKQKEVQWDNLLSPAIDELSRKMMYKAKDD